MKRLNEDLKKEQFSQIYLLYGEEAYLKKQYRDRLRKALLPEDDTINYSHFEGKGIDVKEVIDLAETMPFFAERRLIVFENTGLFKSAAGAELAEYMKQMPETTYFVFVEEEVDKRGKMYKAVKAYGQEAEFPFQDENTLKRWIAVQVSREQKKIRETDVLYFMDKVGTDMGYIARELEKVFCYTMDRDVITREDLDAVCVTQFSNHIYDMVTAVTEKQQKKALEMYYELTAMKAETAMRIFGLLTRQYRYLFQIKQLVKKGYGRREIAEKTGLHPFAVGKYMEQSKKISLEELREIIEDSADMEERIKTGLLSDRMAVELFLIKYSQKR